MSKALQIIHDVEEMKVRGAYLITQTAIEALALRARELAPDGDDACSAGVLAAADRLIASQPSMAGVENGCVFVVAPLREGETDRWSARQIEETVAARAAAHTLPRADLALAGVDTFLTTGAVVNKMGTLPLALACRHHGKPLYAAGSSFKFSVASQRGDAVGLKTRPDDAGIAPPELSGDPRLTVENAFFEVIPARFFEGVITEYGLQPPAATPSLWAQTWATLLEATQS